MIGAADDDGSFVRRCVSAEMQPVIGTSDVACFSRSRYVCVAFATIMGAYFGVETPNDSSLFWEPELQ